MLSLYVADSLVVLKCKPDRIEINLKKMNFLFHIPFCWTITISVRHRNDFEMRPYPA